MPGASSFPLSLSPLLLSDASVSREVLGAPEKCFWIHWLFPTSLLPLPCQPLTMAAIRKKLVIGGWGLGRPAFSSSSARTSSQRLHVPTVFENYIADIEVDGKQVKANSPSRLTLEPHQPPSLRDSECLVLTTYPCPGFTLHPAGTSES